MKKRAVAYIRVSTASDAQLHSFEFQEDYWRNKIAEMPAYELVAIYADRGISGKQTNNRKQFLAMVESAEKGEFDTIFVKSVSRFSRCAVDTLSVVKRLREKGVNIIFENENIDTKNPTSELYLTVASAIAEDAVRTNADNMRWSTRKRFAEGKVNIGHGTFGLRMLNGEIVIEESEAAVIRLIFELYQNGYGKQGIANELMERGIKNVHGGAGWSAQTISTMLHNERYTGCALLQKSLTIKGKRVKNDGSVAQYFVENSHPAIIDRETFDKVQMLIQERREGCEFNFLEDDEYAFRSKIVCGICGKGYIHKINNAGTPYARALWACHTYLKNGVKYCASHTIFNDILTGLFVTAYNEFVASKEEYLQKTDVMAQKAKALEDERKLNALHVRKLITAEEFKAEHAEILARIEALDAEVKRQALSDVAGKSAKPITAFEAAAVRQFLERAVIKDNTVTFEFTNGFAVTKEYTNGKGGNKKGWQIRRKTQCN
jgi:DNA invertase Pin-like site-specific DNA recombinase